MNCHGNQFLYRRMCVARGTISPPSFKGLCCKLTEIARIIYLMLCWVESMRSSVISFAYFTHFSNLTRCFREAYTELPVVRLTEKSEGTELCGIELQHSSL